MDCTPEAIATISKGSIDVASTIEFMNRVNFENLTDPALVDACVWNFGNNVSRLN
jgi:hypothetical protein